MQLGDEKNHLLFPLQEEPLMPSPIHPTSKAHPAHRRLALNGLALLTLASIALPATAIPVKVDTSSRQGEEAILSIVLLDGDFTGNNLAVISNLMTDGTLGAAECSNGCQDLSSAFLLDDDNVLGEFLQPLTLGSFVSFDVTFSNAFKNLTDTTWGLVATSDLLIGEFIGLDGFETDLNDPIAPVPFQNALFVANLADDTIVGATGIATVPIPAGFVLMASGLALLGARRKGFLSNDRNARQTPTTPNRQGEDQNA